MALYNHISSKRDLLRAAAEHILAEIRFDDGGPDWRRQVEACFRAIRRTCLRHPGTARLLEIEGVAPVAVFMPMQVTLDALTAAGMAPDNGLRAYFVLLSYTRGSGPARGRSRGAGSRARSHGRRTMPLLPANGISTRHSSLDRA